MFTRSLFWIALLSLVALAAFTLACGGSSNSTTTKACTGSYTVVGDWQGSVTANGSTDPLVGTINSAGSVVLFDSLADIAVIDSITGTCSFSSESLTAYASAESGAVGTATGTASGNVTSDSAFNGSESINNTTGSFTFSSYNPLGTGSVTAVSGTVLADVQGQVLDSLILTLGGTSSAITFSGTDANNCNVSGTFAEEGTNNVYDVTFDISGGTCTSQSYTGSGFEANSAILQGTGTATGTYLYAVLTSSSTPFVVEILPSGGRFATKTRPTAHTNGFRSIFGIRPRI